MMCVTSLWISRYVGTLIRRLQDELKKELGDLEQESLNDLLRNAEPAPIHIPPGATKTAEGRLVVLFVVALKLTFL